MLNLPVKITLNDAGTLAQTLTSYVASQPDSVVVDAQQLVEFDSSALAVLLACRRAALAAGKQFAVKSLPGKLAQLATLYGVGQLLMPSVEIEQY